jgi:hypothetical protein
MSWWQGAIEMNLGHERRNIELFYPKTSHILVKRNIAPVIGTNLGEAILLNYYGFV